MINDAEQRVSAFYNAVGWKTEGGVTEDAKRFEDLRECAKEYVSKCRLRVLAHLPDSSGNMLDMGSGPIQYKEYLEYSKRFTKRYCVDLSSMALDAAKRKIGEHGVFLCGSFFDLELKEHFFDCTISLHTIYHIDKEKQEEAVRKLIRVTKPGMPIIIVYSNPKACTRYLLLPFRLFGSVTSRIRRLLSKQARGKEREPDLYFFAHPIEWWDRFRDVADVRVLPWRSFSSGCQKALIPNNELGKRMFSILFSLEERFPGFFAKHFQYPMIILKK